MGKKRVYSAKPSTTSGDRCRASLPGLDLLLGIGAGGGPLGPQANGSMPAALGQTPQKPPGQIPCQHKAAGMHWRVVTDDLSRQVDSYKMCHTPPT